MWVSGFEDYFLQFLDLDDVDHNEQNYVKSLLYSVRSPRLELPWVEPEDIQEHWPQEQYDVEGEINVIEGGDVAPTNEVYPVAVGVQTSMQQIYHQVVPPIPNIPPAAYVPQPAPPPTIGYSIPPYMYTDERSRRPRSKPSPKRSDRRDASGYPAPTVLYQSPFPIHGTMPTTPYQYISQAPSHIPSAQHAAGPPLYLAAPPTIPVFPAIYHQSYTPLFSPHIPHDEYNKEQPLLIEERNDREEYEKHGDKPPSLPINAIKTTVPPPAPIPVKKQSKTPTVTPVPVAPVPGETAPSVSPSPPAPVTTPAPAPVQAPPPVTAPPVAPPEEKPQTQSWAGLFKPSDSPRESTIQRKPPISAVAAVARAPNLESKAPVPAKPHPNSDEDPLLRRLGECLSTYELEHKALVLTPRGLTNPSNYCYINATLQALLACPAFYNLIKVISKVKDAVGGPPPGGTVPKSKTPIIDSMVQFIKEFSPATVNRTGRREKSMWKDKEELDIAVDPPFEPTYVYKMLHVLRNETAFQVEGRQEDAEEFLSLLLNGLNDEMLELMKIVDDSSKTTPLVNGDVAANGETLTDDSSDWKEVSKGIKNGRVTRRAEMGKSPLSEIFRGQLRSRLQRADENSGSKESTDNVQPFFTLPLDIESSESVGEALEKYLGGWDQVETSGTSQAWQQLSLEQLPNVLILHLKCFDYRQQTCLKIPKALDFPIDLKIDPKLVSNKNKSSVKMRQYKLFAVVYHDGKEASKGHYLADVYHVGSGGWIRYDDANVRAVNETTLLKPSPPRVPYLLYYRRADTIGQHNNLPR